MFKYLIIFCLLFSTPCYAADVTKGWRFYDDDGVEPTAALADENVKPTLANNTDIVRLRLCHFTDGAGDRLISVLYSDDDATWTALDAGNEWNWANGQATHGNYISGAKITDTDQNQRYMEQNGLDDYFDNGKNMEWDIALVPTGTVAEGTTYYFRIYAEGTGIAPDGGETTPQVLTATTTSRRVMLIQ